MNAESQQKQLIATGRIIAAAAEIETRMVRCGASGSGLREKADSLGDRLPPEVHRLLHFIGAVRNRVAHENEQLRPDEIELFEEAAAEIRRELDALAQTGATAPVNPPPASPPATAKTAPARSRQRTPVKSLPERKPEREAAEIPHPVYPEEICLEQVRTLQNALPPPESTLWASLPGVHLIYAFLLGWSAFREGQLYVLMIFLECAALALLGYAWRERMPVAAIAGGMLFLLIWLTGAVHGWRLNRAEQKKSWLFWIPLLNLGWLGTRLLLAVDYVRLLAALTIFAVWGAAIWLLLDREYIAALVLAGISWVCALADSFLRGRGEQSKSSGKRLS